MNYIDKLATRIRTEVPYASLPDDDTHLLFRMYAVLLLGKQEKVTLADVHNAWSAWMASREPDHESLIPFEDLPESITKQDQIYVDAIVRISNSVRPPHE